MKYNIYLSDELGALIEKDSAERSMTPVQFIPLLLANHYKAQLQVDKDLAAYDIILEELKKEIVTFVNTLEPGQTFVLRDIPFYNSIPDSIRVRIARSVQKLVTAPPANDTELSDLISRKYRPNGKPALLYGAAIYIKNKEKGDKK